MIKLVAFDVGETLIDETRHWAEWADWLGVPRLTLAALLGAAIARGEHHRAVFARARPGMDLAVETARREASGWTYRFELGDFYPDALTCLNELAAAGYRIGIAGNQPLAAQAALAAAGVRADFIAASQAWGVEKPAPAFFERLAAEAGLPADRIAYVGDRLDNDVLPARAAGMTAVLIRRGPWGLLHAERPEAARASAIINSLAELAPLLAGLRSGAVAG
jgi:FMN phosphatase YigB (HAD superfamily)